MRAFHNDEAIKTKYLNRVIEHQKDDRLIKGIGWKNGKGCAVGCTLENYNHESYEVELGIPEWLARVEDTLFEGMSLEKSKTWPEVFLKAIPVGADCEQAKVPFIVMVLESTLESMCSCEFDEKSNPGVAAAIHDSMNVVEQMIEAQKSGDIGLIQTAESAARSAAWSAAESAASAAESAARSAARSAAASSAWSAESAAWSARSAARNARSARSAAWSARSAAYDYFADELIEILSSLFGEKDGRDE